MMSALGEVLMVFAGVTVVLAEAGLGVALEANDVAQCVALLAGLVEAKRVACGDVVTLYRTPAGAWMFDVPHQRWSYWCVACGQDWQEAFATQAEADAFGTQHMCGEVG